MALRVPVWVISAVPPTLVLMSYSGGTNCTLMSISSLSGLMFARSPTLRVTVPVLAFLFSSELAEPVTFTSSSTVFFAPSLLV